MSGAAGAGLHLVKLCVGAESVSDLSAWQKSRAARHRRFGAQACPVHVTRMWPRREAKLLDGGSLYWVIRGVVSVRQRILALEPATDGEGVRRCAIVLDPALVRTEPRAMRPFQGWRYLKDSDAPADLATGGEDGGDLPPELQAGLSAMGLRRK